MGLIIAIALAVSKGKVPYSEKARIKKTTNEPTKIQNVRTFKKAKPIPSLVRKVLIQRYKNIKADARYKPAPVKLRYEIIII